MAAPLFWVAACVGMVCLGPPLIMLTALALNAVSGRITPTTPAASHIGLAMLQFMVVLFAGGPVGEEFGWRGYLLPALVRKLGWRWAGLIVGAIRALWHLPLFYMAEATQSHMPMARFMASSVALSVLFARQSVNTGFSVLPARVLHRVVEPNCPIPGDHISPRRSAFFMARSGLRDIRGGVCAC